MLRPSHPLFQAASDAPSSGSGPTPAQVAATLPADFSANSSTVSGDTMIEVGEASHEGPSLQPQEALQGQQPVQQGQPLPQGQQAQTFQPTELQPLPATLQPGQQPAAQVQQEPVVADPLAAMTASMRIAFPGDSPAQIAGRVATALAPAQQQQVQQQEQAIDPDVQRAEQMATQIATLREQARTEGTSDLDEQITTLERDHLKLEARLEARQEIIEQQEVTRFATESNRWDTMADQTFPDVVRTGTPLQSAVDVQVKRIIRDDPDYFSRSTDAGFQLVATEAAKLGIAPQRQQQGSPPSPGAPGTIQVPPAMPGSVQGSHRPAQQVQQSAGQVFAESLKVAEQGGLAGEIALANKLLTGGFMTQGVQFVS